MSVEPAHLDQARRVADAVLYEGYLLYPYRRSAAKNQARFQFGVLMPPCFADADGSERSFSQTECVLESPADATVWILARFLQLRRRTVQAVMPGTGQLADVAALTVGGTTHTCWDEAAEREHLLSVPVAALLERGAEDRFHVDGGEDTQEVRDAGGRPAGRLTWRWAAIDGTIQARAERLPGPYGALRLRVRVENRTVPPAPVPGRDEALRHALIAVHALIGAPAGAFLSMTDPPEWAARDVAACVNVGTWPVLAGPAGCRSLVLSSPVILYDHPEVAPESAGDLFDATEIDEILTLRTLALTDAEKQEARATDPRAAELIDRLDGLPPEMLERLHGAIRYLGPAGRVAQQPPSGTGPAGAHGPGTAPHGPGTAPQPWWDPGADASVSPETDHVDVAGVRIARGSRVRLRPGARRADAQDLFLAGREAVVEAVLFDVDGAVHLAVSLPGDPAADLQRSHGRFLYFAPDEVEPLDRASSGSREDQR
ncbi:MAG TPA: hypothetical protein VKV35_11710 [Streptosporangiaceae bacterium]|jgi:hypothetical protein|nr:hypothetical protein [Streptosporangiaceae bacterium]